MFIGATGSTPSTSLGARSSFSGQFNTEREDIFLGAPRRFVGSIPAQEELTLEVTIFEWSLNNLARALGVGTTTSTTYAFGEGSTSVSKFALRAKHRVLGSGNTIDVRIWEAEPQGEFNLELSDDLADYTLAFMAVRATTDWASNTVDEYGKVHDIS